MTDCCYSFPSIILVLCIGFEVYSIIYHLLIFLLLFIVVCVMCVPLFMILESRI